MSEARIRSIGMVFSLFQGGVGSPNLQRVWVIRQILFQNQ
jgi:hypothetical protein